MSVPRHKFLQPSLAPACLSVVCSLLLFSLLSFFRAGFPGVVWKQEVRSSHFGHPRGSRGGCAASPCSGKGSGTKSTGRRPKNRASFRYPPTVRGALMAIAVLIYWWDTYVQGLRFLALPAVTSASDVLTQTYRSPVRVLRFP